MSKAAFNLSDFQSLIFKDGLARPNRFEVMIQSPTILSKFSSNYKIINLLCESAVFPPHIIGVKPQHIYGPQYQRPFGVEYGGEGIGLGAGVGGAEGDGDGPGVGWDDGDAVGT